MPMAYGQTLSIFPQQITPTDTIYLVATVSLQQTPVNLVSYNITDSGDSIKLEACYSAGWWTIPGSRTDTFNLGVKPNGFYEVIFEVQDGLCDGTNITYDVLSFSVGTSLIVANDNEKIILFPNPAKDHISVQTGNSSPLILTIYNSLGEKVFDSVQNSSENSIDLTELEKGAYLVQIETEGTIYYKKFIKN